MYFLQYNYATNYTAFTLIIVADINNKVLHYFNCIIVVALFIIKQRVVKNKYDILSHVCSYTKY